MPSRQPPKVWPWYVAYCIALAVVYFVLIGLGIICFFIPGDLAPEDRFGIIFMGVLLIGLGLVFSVGFALGPFLPKKPWVWIYGMVLICTGMTSACCIPASIPLLIFWLKPETKQFFGKVAS